MKNILVQVGTKYQLHIAGPTPYVDRIKDKVSLGIRCQGNFDPKTNFVAVMLDKETLTKIVADLKERLEGMDR